MIFAIAENIRSLYNVGALFRTADGAGVTRLYLTGISGRPPHREIRKVALGAEEAVSWEYHEDSVTLARQLRGKGIKIVCSRGRLKIGYEPERSKSELYFLN